MKTNITISVDPEVIKEARSVGLRGEISNICEQAIKKATTDKTQELKKRFSKKGTDQEGPST